MSIAEKLTTIADNEPKVYEAGKREMNEEWWKAFTGDYVRTDYGYAFQYADLSKVGAPKKSINVTSMSCMFRYYKGESIPKCFDCSSIDSAATLTHSFRYAQALKTLPDLKIPAVAKYAGTWQFCNALETIEIVRCNENTVFDATFYCTKLKNITFEGVIGQNISFASSPLLSKESLLSNGGDGVFGKLKDYNGTGESRTITLHADTKALLTDAEKAIATQKGWTVS